MTRVPRERWAPRPFARHSRMFHRSVMKRRAIMSPEIAEKARRWVVTLASGGVSEEELNAFKRWRKASPHNAKAFDEARRSYANADRHHGTLTRRTTGLRFLDRSASIAAMLIIAVSAGWWAVGVRSDYATPEGPGRSVMLTDGSRLFLDGDSAVDVQFLGHKREVRLLRGQASFDVAHDPARPFIVSDGSGEAVAVGTEFAVARRSGRTIVAVAEGIVQLSFRQTRLTLQARQSGEWSTTLKRVAYDADQLSWREGRIIIENAPLDEAIAALDRYVTGRVIVIGDEAREGVSGVFDTANANAGLEAIANARGLKVTRIGLLVILHQ